MNLLKKNWDVIKYSTGLIQTDASVEGIMSASILAHMINNLTASLQADFFNSNPGESTFWIFNIVLIVGLILLAVPFFKADAATIE